MNKIIFVLSFLFSISLFNCGQDTQSESATPTKKVVEKTVTPNPEEKLIREKINMYFEGWMTGDTSKLGKAMQMTCQLKNVDGNKVKVFDRATYLGFFKPRPRRENTEGRILKIDITGNIGSAKCQIETEKKIFTDYFNLMKLGDEWFIVDKIATSKEKG